MTELLSDVTVIVPARDIAGHVDVCRHLVRTVSDHGGHCVLVDDGSTDGSDLALKDMARVCGAQYLRCDGAGPGLARNAGLRIATTTYVTFVDSDDEIYPEGYAVLLQRMRLADASVGRCSMAVVGDPGRSRRGVRPILLPSTDQADSERLITETSGIAGVVLRRDWLHQEGITFPSGRLGEDQAFMARVAGRCRSMVEVPNVGYSYRFREGGQLTSQPTPLEEVFHTFVEARDAVATPRDRRIVWFAVTRVTAGLCARQSVGLKSWFRALTSWLALRPQDIPSFGLVFLRVVWAARYGIAARILR